MFERLNSILNGEGKEKAYLFRRKLWLMVNQKTKETVCWSLMEKNGKMTLYLLRRLEVPLWLSLLRMTQEQEWKASSE